jgi:hypothetical protein
VRKSRPGVRLNEHLEHPEGDLVFRHKMGLGGSSRSGWDRTAQGAEAPAVRREAEEEWGKARR